LNRSPREGEPSRPTAFLSYYHGDADAAISFIRSFGEVFQRVLSVGVSNRDTKGWADDENLLLDRIRLKYLADSSVTIVLIGETTWSRRFIDWEIAATLGGSHPRALMGVLLPTVGTAPRLPERLASSKGQPIVWPYPQAPAELRKWIEEVAAVGSGPTKGRLLRRDHLTK